MTQRERTILKAVLVILEDACSAMNQAANSVSHEMIHDARKLIEERLLREARNGKTDG